VATYSKSTDGWKVMSSGERSALIAILGSVVVLAIAVVLAVDVDSAGAKGGFGPRLLTMLFNFEDDRTHIVSYPLLWVARALLVAVVLCVVWSVRARKARMAEAAADTDSE
jgi:cytochrome bd-type quinol oxidase subunit 2